MTFFFSILIRMWSTLIIKGHELRECCCKVLRSTDYSILTEEKSICDSVDGLATLIANSELGPFPSCNLTWACEEELADAIKFHGHIVEEAGKILYIIPLKGKQQLPGYYSDLITCINGNNGLCLSCQNVLCFVIYTYTSCIVRITSQVQIQKKQFFVKELFYF